MLNIAICDDDLLFALQTRNEISAILGSSVKHDVTVFQSGNSLLNSDFFDIIFLDIEMKGLSGIETAEKIRLKNDNSKIVFITSHQKYVFSAFDVSASHYLLKPLDVQKLKQVLTKITAQLTAEKEYCCTVKCGFETHRIPFSQIKFAEVLGRRVTLHTIRESFSFNGTLNDMQKAFPDYFFRCHKSYLVNLFMVIKYDKETASLKSGETIPIARRKFAEFGSAFLAFLRDDNS